jgi:hypothetical protein
MTFVLGVWAFVRALLVNSAAVSLENVALRHQLAVMWRPFVPGCPIAASLYCQAKGTARYGTHRIFLREKCLHSSQKRSSIRPPNKAMELTAPCVALIASAGRTNDILNPNRKGVWPVVVGVGWLSGDGHEGYDPANADC